MYRFIIKMLSHSSTEHNVCTHTHPHGHARKCCQITLVHTHGHTRAKTRYAGPHCTTRTCSSASRLAAHTPCRKQQQSCSVSRARRLPVVPHTCAAKATSELHRLRRPPPPLLPTAASSRRQQQALVPEEVSCAHGDQWWRPRRSIGHGELHLRAPTEHPLEFQFSKPGGGGVQRGARTHLVVRSMPELYRIPGLRQGGHP